MRSEQKLLDKLLDSGTNSLFISARSTRSDKWGYEKIKIYSAHDTHSQVKKVGEILSAGYNPSETAIILPDSSAVIPLLSEVIGKLDSKYNVSLGYPLSSGTLNAFLESVIRLQESASPDGYYLKDYYALMTHPYSRGLMPDTEKFNYEDFIKLCGEHLQRSFAKLEEIESIFNGNVNGNVGLKKLHRLLIAGPSESRSPVSAAACLKEIVNEIYLKTALKNDLHSATFVSAYLEKISEFGNSLFCDHEIASPAVYELFKYYISGSVVPFSGVPLEGLQILGMLETRNLSFKKIIVLDVNEGLVPNLSKYDPILPDGVRKIIGLSTYSEREEIYRRNFISLVSAAADVHLIYKTHGKNSRSRFIEEIIWEKEKSEGVVCSEERLIDSSNLNISVLDRPAHCLIKTPAALEILSNMRFSPSGLDTYIHCPAKFYFRYILALEEMQEAEIEPDAANIGSSLHKILEEFYQPFIGKKVKLSKKDFSRLEKIINKQITEKFGPISGEIYLMSRIIKNRMALFFEKEKQRKNWKILATEKRIAGSLDADGRRISIGGIIDRIDQREELIYIVDYKSGGFSIPSKKLLAPLEKREEIKKLIDS